VFRDLENYKTGWIWKITRTAGEISAAGAENERDFTGNAAGNEKNLSNPRNPS
jgi:hypothetical protein